MATALGKAGKNWRKTPDFPALPSVIARTLGKAGLFAECQATALGKGEGFAECQARALGKVGGFAECQATALGRGEGFAECQATALGKETFLKEIKILCREPTLGKQFWEKNYINSLPSVILETLGKATVMVNGHFSLPSVRSTLGKGFVECPTNDTRQRRLCRLFFLRVAFAECSARQSLCRVFLSLCRVP